MWLGIWPRLTGSGVGVRISEQCQVESSAKSSFPQVSASWQAYSTCQADPNYISYYIELQRAALPFVPKISLSKEMIENVKGWCLLTVTVAMGFYFVLVEQSQWFVVAMWVDVCGHVCLFEFRSPSPCHVVKLVILMFIIIMHYLCVCTCYSLAHGGWFESQEYICVWRVWDKVAAIGPKPGDLGVKSHPLVTFPYSSPSSFSPTILLWDEGNTIDKIASS